MKKIIYFILKLIIMMVCPRRPIVAANMQRVLVIKLCCIGDILFTTPMLRALQEQLPRAKVTYMVSSWCRSLVESDSRVDAIIEFNAYDKVGLLEKAKRVWQVVKEIRARQFDGALILHRTPLSGILAAAGRVPVRIGFNWEGAGFAHTHPVPFRAEAHEIDRNLDCIKIFGGAPTNKAPELNPDQEACTTAKQLLLKQGYTKSEQPLIAIFPGGGVNPGTVMTTKRWSLDGYQEVCRKLENRYHASLLFVGNDQDRLVSDALLKEQSFSNVFRAEGKTSLMELAALLQQCDLFIGGDSGPLHMADAVGTATVSIFGPTDPHLLAPRGDQHRVIREPLRCSPCFTPITVREGNVNECKEGTMACMKTIDPEKVIEAAEELLEERGYIRQ